MADEPEVRITVGGKRVYTIAQAAALRGVEPSHLRTVIARAGGRPVARLDARTPLYDARDLDRMFENRVGPGAPGQPKPRKTGSASAT